VSVLLPGAVIENIRLGTTGEVTLPRRDASIVFARGLSR
jgi:hypothetical protein